MDPVFEEEQQHLSEVYAKLQARERELAARLESNLQEVTQFKGTMSDELATNVDNDDYAMETYAEYAVMNNVVDSFNISIDLDTESLARTRTLLRKPYFAKVRLRFPGKAVPRDVYLGTVGATDEKHRSLVVDWRSPVAETYYNQQTGPMTYEANGRTVHVDLELRRQFDIERDRLNSYFDTTVAIEDPLLLQSLANRRTSQLASITATIQREQNTVIRCDDVPALLVRGVAGSGKTSVMLQRIAYLLFKERESLRADQVYLVTPNPVFGHYIKNVLPELGEKNPNVLQWGELMERLGPGDRSLGDDVDPAVLDRIDDGLASLELGPADVCEVRGRDRVLLSAEQVWRTVEKVARRVPAGPRLTALVEEELLEKLEHKAHGLAANEHVQDEMLSLPDEEQERVFGGPVEAVTDEDLREYACTYVEDLVAPAAEAVRNAEWLRLDRIGMRMLGEKSLTGAEWLFLKMTLTGLVDERAKFVMVDEVQDYTATQLAVLARYFSRAHFLLLGDENQAIRPGTASFAEVERVFTAARGSVARYDLMTSYRSAPQVTDLFARLMPEGDRMSVASVQRPGPAPRIQGFSTEEAYVGAVAAEVRAAARRPGLTAVVTRDRKGVKWLERRLAQVMGAEAPEHLRRDDVLPEGGVVLLDLALAKGLEFDHVVVADASERTYPVDDLSRRCLYTAVSRATQEVVLLSNGPLTKLLD